MAAIVRIRMVMVDESVTDRAKALFDVVRRTVLNFLNQEGMQWAGAVAFYLVLSVPPMLIAASSIAILFMGSEQAQQVITDTVTQFVPVERDLISEIAEQTVGSIGPAAIISIIFLLFSGTRIFAAIITAINVMWDQVEQAGFVRTQIVRAIFLVTVGALFVLAGALDAVVAMTDDALPLDGVALWIVQSELIPFTLLFLALFALLKLVPKQSATWTSAAIGAAVGALGLRIAQFGFTAFLATLGDFETAYGPLAGIAALMTWALVASVTVLLAAHLVAVLNRPETPTGGERPERGDGDGDGDEGADRKRTPGQQEPGKA